MGEWQFGCDVCQQVCPWNRFAPERGDAGLAPRPGIPPENPAGELGLSPQAFNRKYKGSPVKRAKRRGYLRNTSVVLGNAGEVDSVPALAAALRDDEPLVRAHAAWALGNVGTAQARAALQSALAGEEDAAVVAEIKLALSETA